MVFETVKENTMKNKLLTTIMATAAGAALLVASAMPAQAVDKEITIYGASAQFIFWNNLADDFLLDDAYGNCGGYTKWTDTGSDTTAKYGVVKGNTCSGFGLAGAADDTITIRYAAKASYDGIFALQGAPCKDAGGNNRTCNGDQPMNELTSAITWSTVDPNGCGNPQQRRFGNETNLTGGNLNVTETTGGICKTVNIAASDVTGQSFTQITHGKLKGHLGGVQTDRVFPGSGIWTEGSWLCPGDENYYRYENYQPVVVPFGFFVNQSVTVNRCQTGAYAGEQCTPATAASDCGTGVTCSAQTLDNVSREMVVNIFSGNAYTWQDFGTGFAANPIVACLRHAGSGTHATMDYAVVKGNGWGALLAQDEKNGTNPDGTTYNYRVWFNDGSSDEMKCINQLTGAIGYADADQSLTSYPNARALKYQGYRPSRVNVRNGAYDFWSNQNAYYRGLEAPPAYNNDTNTCGDASSGVDPTYDTTHEIYEAMMTYASIPANIDTLGSRFWATSAEMVYGKGSDQSYPVWQGASDPQTP